MFYYLCLQFGLISGRRGVRRPDPNESAMVELSPSHDQQHEVDEWLSRQRRLSQELRPELVQID